MLISSSFELFSEMFFTLSSCPFYPLLCFLHHLLPFPFPFHLRSRHLVLDSIYLIPHLGPSPLLSLLHGRLLPLLDPLSLPVPLTLPRLEPLLRLLERPLESVVTGFLGFVQVVSQALEFLIFGLSEVFQLGGVVRAEGGKVTGVKGGEVSELLLLLRLELGC